MITCINISFAVAPGSAATSLCEPHREFIEAQLRLKRNAMAIFQDLVDSQGFAGQYNSVKRFCAARWPFSVAEMPCGTTTCRRPL